MQNLTTNLCSTVRQTQRALLIFSALTLILVSKAVFTDVLWLEAEELAGKLGSPSLLVVDARAEKEYLVGHLPGAVNLPVDKTFDPENKFRVVGLADIQKLFRKAGIEKEKEVVVYDNGEFIDAARLFWVMEAYGLSIVRLLNGGVRAWKVAGYELSREKVAVTETTFIPMTNPDRVASVLRTKLATKDENTVIIDARPNIEYMGKESKATRNGHIPSAISIPWNENFVQDDSVLRIKSVNELRELYSPIKDGKSTVTYCNKGKQSSLSYFILRSLGHDVSHFDGSWHVWGNDPELPISK